MRGSQLAVEGLCVSMLSVFSYGASSALQLGPVHSSLKRSTQTAHNLAFTAVVLAVFVITRIYLHLANAASDKTVLLIAVGKKKDEKEEKKDGEKEEDSNTLDPVDGALRMCLMGAFVVCGPLLFYLVLPGASGVVDGALAELFGDVPAMLWAAGLKERTRVWVLAKRFFGLLLGYFLLLFVVERMLHGLLVLLRMAFRAAAGGTEPESAPESADEKDEADAQEEQQNGDEQEGATLESEE